MTSGEVINFEINVMFVIMQVSVCEYYFSAANRFVHLRRETKLRLHTILAFPMSVRMERGL